MNKSCTSEISKLNMRHPCYVWFLIGWNYSRPWWIKKKIEILLILKMEIYFSEKVHYCKRKLLINLFGYTKNCIYIIGIKMRFLNFVYQSSLNKVFSYFWKLLIQEKSNATLSPYATFYVYKLDINPLPLLHLLEPILENGHV